MQKIFQRKSLFSNSVLDEKAQNTSFLNADYIIVGGGTAGCIIAHQLSEKNSVLVLEKGDLPPSNIHLNLTNSEIQNLNCLNIKPCQEEFLDFNNQYFATLKSNYINGNKVGGISTVAPNLVVYPPLSTLSEWQNYNIGTNDWSKETIQPIFNQLENYQGYTNVNSNVNSNRGTDGLFPIIQQFNDSNQQIINPLQNLFSDAIINVCGSTSVIDYNDLNFENCVSKYPQFLQENKNGLINRFHSEKLIHNFINSDGNPISTKQLTIRFNALVEKIIFDGDSNANANSNVNPNAFGVKFNWNGRSFIAKAAKKIIITAGTETPLLLMRSGIGSFPMLKKSNFPTIYDNANVGKNLQNHISIPLIIRFPKNQNNSNSISGIAFINNGKDNDRKYEILCYSNCDFLDNNFKTNLNLNIPLEECILLTGTDLSPLSRGSIQIENNLNKINPNFFSDANDIENVVDLYIQMYDIYQEMKNLYPTENLELIWPTENIFKQMDRKVIFKFAASSCIPKHHWCGTTKMAKLEENGVVNPQNFHVWGVKNLMIGDLSLAPVIPKADTLFFTMAIAMKTIQYVNR